PLDDLKPVWEAGKELALRDASERTIKTRVDIDGNSEVDAGEFIDFDTGNASTLRPFLNAATDAEAEKIIRFIRGEEVAGYRDRTLTVDGSEKEWKLGDIVYSTPTVVGKPMENYNQYYSDYNFGEFFLKWRERGISVYVGANDGMLHSFKVGTFNQGDNPATVGEEEHGWYSATEDPATSENLGDERWAYIPYHLLPHLKWLTDPDYAHVYYTDLKPKVSDVRIFKSPNGNPIDANHPQGWGTILIGGMRLGGGALTLTDDFGNGPGETRTFRSAYFALDITVPDSPVLLGEFTDPNLAFATSYPAIARVEATQGFEKQIAKEDDKWYFVVGSGPGSYTGSSNQQGHTFVVDLNNGSNQLELLQTFTGNENDAFMATPITVDLNLNYNVDTIYIGETYDDSGTWKGKMYRISTRSNDDPAPEPAVWPYKTDPTTDPWLMTTLFSADTPITASANASMDDDENIWIYFGTGRYYSSVDQTDTTYQNFYGIKDACAYGGCGGGDEVALADLHDSSNVMVMINKEVVNAASNNWDDFLSDVQAKDGWYLSFDTGGERVLNRPGILGGVVIFPTFNPIADVCSSGGSGKMYALYYETGTAYHKSIVGTETYGDTEKCLKSIDLGDGVTSAVGIHVGGKSTGTGFIQQSTGVVKQIDIAPVFGIKGGITGWKQK
ncbi:MAG: PilC/PilY family type IV pilus protein, partial [Dehalococcoidales bacterium]